MKSTLAHVQRNAFAERLTTSLAAVGCEASPTAFARQFNIRAPGLRVSVHGVRKWLIGEAVPTQDKLQILAQWLNVSPQWLRFGEGIASDGEASNDSSILPTKEIRLLNDFRRLDRRSQSIVEDLIFSMLKHDALKT